MKPTTATLLIHLSILVVAIFVKTSSASLKECVKGCVDAYHALETKEDSCSASLEYAPAAPAAAATASPTPVPTQLAINLDVAAGTLSKNYANLIRDIRTSFNGPKKAIEVTISTGGSSFTLIHDWDDLYIHRVRIGTETQTVAHEYDSRTIPRKVSSVNIKSAAADLCKGFDRFNKTSTKMSENFRMMAGFTAESARFGLLRYSYQKVLQSTSESFDLADCADVLGDWVACSKKGMASPSPTPSGTPNPHANKRVGLDDPCNSIQGNGNLFATYCLPRCGLASEHGGCSMN